MKLKKHDRVRCINADEPGIPLVKGALYTVQTTFKGPQSCTEAPIPGMEYTPGVTLKEVPGHFRADRFEPAFAD